MTPDSLLPGLEPPASDDAVEGVVERIVYSNPDTGWSVLRLALRRGEGTVTAVGRFPGIQPGECLRLSGQWERDRRYGRQFRAITFVALEPSTLEGIERFLGSGLIPGIGPVMAGRIVARFGLDTLEVIGREPGRLVEVEGIGSRRAESIRQAWSRQRGVREVFVFLQSLGVTAGQAARIHRRFGDDSVAAVRENPFRLAAEVPGIGFQTADRIAASLGMAPDAPPRAAAGLLFVLHQGSERGHLYLPEKALRDQTAALLGLPAELVSEALDALAEERRIVRERWTPGGDEAIYARELHAAEEGVAERIRELASASIPATELALDGALAWFERRHGLQLAPRQRRAVAEALGRPILIITGGPGTGKTTLVRAVVEIARRQGGRVLLAAPTGRAANRLGEATAAEARTLHRLLEFDPRSAAFQRHRKRPLEASLLVVDEVSMLDCPLAHHLLEAVPRGCRVVLVGDVDQLPSVGPGRVLADLIDSKQVPVVRLQEVFRQAASSSIVRNAHRIRRGEMPDLVATPSDDFFFLDRRRPEDILATLEELVLRRIPTSFGIDPRADIQVLTPMRRGTIGTENLNAFLQQLLNPGGAPITSGRGRLRLGDRVMQVRNNYELEVFNGEVGRILDEEPSTGRLAVSFEGRRVAYEPADAEELTLAYACSVHKSQGSEYPCVLLALHPQHFIMLQRKLIYTAVTRGRRLVVVVGDPSALARAVRNDRPERRHTALARRLA